MNKDEKHPEVTHYWWEKAIESLGSAKREIDAKSYGFTENRFHSQLLCSERLPDYQVRRHQGS